jgi:hypothetical protein
MIALPIGAARAGEGVAATDRRLFIVRDVETEIDANLKRAQARP